MTRVPQLSGRRHIFVTPVATVSLLWFSTCTFVCPRISCFCLDPGFFVTHFHAPISKACRDMLPFDHRFCSSTWSNFRTNRIETTTNSRDILAQTGLVIIHGIDSAGYEVQEPHSPPCRSRSLDVMGKDFESPFPS